MLHEYTTMRPHMEAFSGTWVPWRPDKKSTTLSGSKTEGGFVTIPGNIRTAADWHPLVIMYHPKNIDICNILLRNYSILGNDCNTEVIFYKSSLKAFRRAKILRYLLVHNNLLPGSQRWIGIFPCNRLDCGTCPFINSLTEQQRHKDE